MPIANRYRHERTDPDRDTLYPRIGNYRKRVGIVGGSRTGRRVLELLRALSVEAVVADPYLDDAAARACVPPLMDLDSLIASVMSSACTHPTSSKRTTPP